MLRNKRNIIFLALIITLVTAITLMIQSSKNITEKNSLKPTPKKVVLGFSQLGAESDWRSANSESIKLAAKEAGIELKFSNAFQKQEDQIKAIRSFIAQQVDVIAFSPFVESGWDSVLKEAKIAGIPVVILDRGIDIEDKSLYVAYIGSDFEEEGRKAGRWLVERTKDIKEDINVVEIQGNEGSAPAIGRKKGFEEIIKLNPNIKILKSQPGNFIKSKGKEVMEAFLGQEGKKIDFVFSHNDDMALGAIEAIEEFRLRPGKDIKIISVDAVKAAFEAMTEGKINCSVECNPLQGPQLMQTVKDIMAGKEVPKRILIEEGIFTEETAAIEFPKRKY
jgi:simple sugar transport system substrate-binding protein